MNNEYFYNFPFSSLFVIIKKNRFMKNCSELFKKIFFVLLDIYIIQSLITLFFTFGIILRSSQKQKKLQNIFKNC